MRLYSSGTQTSDAERDTSRRKAMVRMLRKLGVKLSSPPKRPVEPPRAEVDPSFEAACASSTSFRH